MINISITPEALNKSIKRFDINNSIYEAIQAFLIAEGFPTTTNETVKDFVKRYELAAESASAYKLHSTNMENLLNIHLGLFEKIYSNYIYNKDQSSAMSEITKILLNNNKWTS